MKIFSLLFQEEEKKTLIFLLSLKKTDVNRFPDENKRIYFPSKTLIKGNSLEQVWLRGFYTKYILDSNPDHVAELNPGLISHVS